MPCIGKFSHVFSGTIQVRLFSALTRVCVSVASVLVIRSRPGNIASVTRVSAFHRGLQRNAEVYTNTQCSYITLSSEINVHVRRYIQIHNVVISHLAVKSIYMENEQK